MYRAMPTPRPLGGAEGAERLVVVVVHVGEVAQLRRGQGVLGAQEPHLAGPGAQPGEAVRQQRRVGAADLADQHRRPVAQRAGVPSIAGRGGAAWTWWLNIGIAPW